MQKQKKAVTDPKSIISEEYHDFLDVFFKQKVDKLLFHWKYNHSIELLERKKALIYVPLY